MNQTQIFTLIYAERPATSNTLAALIGPTIHKTFNEALDTVFGYVCGRIIECCPAEFVEDFNLTPAKPNTSYQELHGFFKGLTEPQILHVVDWYFGQMNDELSECFYKINPHGIKQINGC